MLLIELNSNSLFWKRLTRCKPILILFDLIDHLVFLIIFQFSSGWRHNLCWLLLRTTTWRKPWRKKHWSCVFCRAVSSEKPKLLRHIWGGSMEARVVIHCPISWDLTWELCYRPGDWQGWFYWRLWGEPTIYRDISKRNTGDKTAHTYNLWHTQEYLLQLISARASFKCFTLLFEAGTTTDCQSKVASSSSPSESAFNLDFLKRRLWNHKQGEQRKETPKEKDPDNGDHGKSHRETVDDNHQRGESETPHLKIALHQSTNIFLPGVVIANPTFAGFPG